MRASLPILVILFLLIPQVTTDIAWSSETDVPEPLSLVAISSIDVDPEDADKGFTLIAPYAEKNVYLVDQDGVVVHTWRSDRTTMGTVQLLEDGTLLRGRSGLSGQNPGVHLLDWDGSVLWDYRPPNPYRYHHDIEPLPNGNILINTLVPYTSSQAIDQGRDPAITPQTLNVEPIIEIMPNGTNGGDIVWMWDPVDHIVQDYDPEKPNYGVVRDHPELVDFNYPREYPTVWQHSNGVAYNAELDQIMITNRNFDEFWVIDHNTTMAEAAGHTGGARGKGGDILYRWGNPQAYDAGNASDHILYGPHDAHWIGPGLPGAGNILVFNNGVNFITTRPEGKITTVEELIPPVNATGGYDLAPGSAYGPSGSMWYYNASPPESFYTASMGGAERLPDGHTLVCGGGIGYNFEVDLKNEVVWEYRSKGPFKVSRYFPPALDVIPDLDATEDVMLKVNISSYISDLDTDLENLEVRENSIYAGISGHELLLLFPDGISTDVINLSVSDGIFEAWREVLVNVAPVNDPPVLAPIPAIEAIEDVPYTLDLAPIVSDPDTNFNQLSITVDSSYVTIEGRELRFLYPEGILTDNVLLVVSDGELEDRAEILVTVTPVDDPPMVDRIQDQEGVEDVPWTIDLGMYIRDIDTPIEDISMASDSPYASVSGLNLTLLYPDGVTMDLVYLTVSDGESGTVVSFNVTVEAVNDAPEIGDILPLTLTEDEPFLLDLGPYIFDVDTPVENLTLRVDSPYIDVEGHILVLLYPDGVNRDEVVVDVWDGELHSSAILVVNVEPVNDPTVLGVLPPLTVTEDEPYTLDLGPYISDIDTPLDVLTLHVDSPFIEADGLILVLLYPEGGYQDEVVVELWDGDLHVSTNLVVIIEAVNDPPYWVGLPGIAAVEDVEGSFDLEPYLGDVDTPLEDLVVEEDSPYGWMDGTIFRFEYPNGILVDQVAFTLGDGEFRVVLRVDVTVSPVNDAPELSGASVDPPEGSAGTTFRFSVVLRDVDIGSGVPVVEVVIDGVAYECARDALATGSYDEGVVFYLETDLGVGTHSYHFTADDGDGGLATTEDLTVAVKNAGGRTNLTAFIVTCLVIGAVVVLVAILLARRRRLPGPPG